MDSKMGDSGLDSCGCDFDFDCDFEAELSPLRSIDAVSS